MFLSSDGNLQHSTRRSVLQRVGKLGLLATVASGIGRLVDAPAAKAGGVDLGPAPTTVTLPASQILPAMPAAQAAKVEAMLTAGCTVCYYRDEGACGTSHCADNGCCYRWAGCGGTGLGCLAVSCATGNFCVSS